jgi:hypothetical protein
MKSWFKYTLELDHNGILAIDRTFSDHAKAMGGYDADSSYLNDDDLFNKYFHGKDLGRLERYFEFILSNLPKDRNILSIASGRGILEYYMKKNGYLHITCSDLDIPFYPVSFNIDYIRFNALETPQTKTSYNAVICLSLIYLFDDDQLKQFFKNMNSLLLSNGLFILDSAGSSDTLLSHLINEYYLYFELWLYRIYKSSIDQSWYHINTQHFGYRRTDEEIIKIAKEYGFILDIQANYNYLVELKRSMIFRKLIERIPIIERVAERIVGRRLPYIRMFKFTKIHS